MNLPKPLKYAIGGIAVAIAAFFAAKMCGARRHRDYPEIASEGILRAVTECNSISYFADGDTISGFHYELVNAFARDHGLQAAITPETSFDKRLSGLESGRYDIIAYSLLATSEVKGFLALTQPVLLNKEVLVQRKPGKQREDTAAFIRSQLELGGKVLHITKGSPAALRIRNLGDEIGENIYIKEVEQYGSEQLVALVAHGDIDYAVCEESIARAMADSLAQIDISTDISLTQFYAWGVSKQSPLLLDSLNAWLNRYQSGKTYQALCRKYKVSPNKPPK